MKRTVKDPVERRNEIIDVAERLFMTIGYEQTAVSDIVREVDVSQGAFYYYFKSKEDVLVAVLEKNLSAMEEDFRQISQRTDLDEAVKLNCMFNQFISNGVTGRKIIGYIHQSKDVALHSKLSKKRPFSRVAPILAGVISQGIEKSRFSVAHPLETSYILLMLLGTFLFTIDQFDAAGGSGLESSGFRQRMRASLEEHLARALGVNDYRFFLQI
jgi:AcrR family transcriptional regulator